MDQQIDSEAMPRGAVLVCSVGGSMEPVVRSIDTHKPEYLVYVASKDTRAKLEEIRRNLAWQGVRDSHVITLTDYQDLLACVRDIRADLRKSFKDMNLPPETLLVADITGGTKVMSSALTLVMMEMPNSRFSYVGGSRRSKEGVGIVETGHELVLRMDNPWDVMGTKEVHDLALAFNSGQYAAAWEKADLLAKRTTRYRKFYSGLANILAAFRDWDIFNFKAGVSALKNGLGMLTPYAECGQPGFAELFRQFQNCQTQLEKVRKDEEILRNPKGHWPLPPDCGRAYLLDLVDNARRRAAFGHYDDAVARLYSAIEKTAKMALAVKGKDNSHLGADDLREAGGDFCAKYAQTLEEKGIAQLPLFESFRYLCALDKENSVARTFQENEAELAKVLEARNKSPLAHDYRPVQKEDYQKLFAIALSFMGIAEDDLFAFPELRARDIQLF